MGSQRVGHDWVTELIQIFKLRTKFLNEGSHRYPLPDMSKFQTPRIKAGVQNKLYCLCKQFRHSEPFLSVLEICGKTPQIPVPRCQPRARFAAGLSKDCSLTYRQLIVLTLLCTSSFMDGSFQLLFPASSPELGSGGGQLGGTRWGHTV